MSETRPRRRRGKRKKGAKIIRLKKEAKFFLIITLLCFIVAAVISFITSSVPSYIDNVVDKQVDGVIDREMKKMGKQGGLPGGLDINRLKKQLKR